MDLKKNIPDIPKGKEGGEVGFCDRPNSILIWEIKVCMLVWMEATHYFSVVVVDVIFF